MAYVKTVWADGDIITPEKLNHLESGVEEAANKPAGNIVNITNNTGDTPAIYGTGLITLNGVNASFEYRTFIPTGNSRMFLYNDPIVDDLVAGFGILSVDDNYLIIVNDGEPLTYAKGEYRFNETANAPITGQTYNVVINDK